MPERRHKLNSKQIELLDIINTFRFVNTELLARFKEVSKASINYSLKILLDQGYISRIYSSSDKLQGRHAVYFLEPIGYRALTKSSPDNKPLKIEYKNRSVSRKFIDVQLLIMDLYIKLSNKYQDNITFYSREDIKNKEYIPNNLIDGMFKIKKVDVYEYYFVFVLDESQYFLLDRKLRKLIDYYDSRDWEELSDSYPSLLIICSSDNLVIKINNKMTKTFENEGINDIDFKVSGDKEFSFFKNSSVPVYLET